MTHKCNFDEELIHLEGDHIRAIHSYSTDSILIESNRAKLCRYDLLTGNFKVWRPHPNFDLCPELYTYPDELMIISHRHNRIHNQGEYRCVYDVTIMDLSGKEKYTSVLWCYKTLLDDMSSKSFNRPTISRPIKSKESLPYWIPTGFQCDRCQIFSGFFPPRNIFSKRTPSIYRFQEGALRVEFLERMMVVFDLKAIIPEHSITMIDFCPDHSCCRDCTDIGMDDDGMICFVKRDNNGSSLLAHDLKKIYRFNFLTFEQHEIDTDLSHVSKETAFHATSSQTTKNLAYSIRYIGKYKEKDISAKAIKIDGNINNTEDYNLFSLVTLSLKDVVLKWNEEFFYIKDPYLILSCFMEDDRGIFLSIADPSAKIDQACHLIMCRLPKKD